MTRVDEHGIILNSLKDNIQEESDRFLKYTGLASVSASSASGEMIAITAEMRTRLEQFMADAINSMTITGAIGIRLDQLAEIYGFKRKDQAGSIVYVEFKGTPNTLINTGTEVTSTVQTKLSFRTIRPYRIEKSGSVIVEASSDTLLASGDTGEIEYRGTIKGITSGKSITPVFTGHEIETDSEFRTRITRTVASPNTKNLLEGLDSALKNTHGVLKVNVTENKTSQSMDGIPTGHFNVTLIGGVDEQIAKIIRSYEALGGMSFGGSLRAIETNGRKVNVYFDRPSSTEVSIKVNLTTVGGFTVIETNEIAMRILSYINSLGIGEDLIRQKIESLALIAGVTKAVVTLNGSSANVTALYNDIIVTNKSKIVVQ